MGVPSDKDREFAERAVREGVITQAQADEAARDQITVSEMGIEKRLDQILVDKRLIERAVADRLLRMIASPDAADASAGAENVPPTELRIPGYTLLSCLGSGAMGQVYRARQDRLDRTVAVKFLLASRAGDQVSVERFLREARATAKLNHPNIIKGIEVGQTDGFHYFVMEYVEGRTLLDLLRDHGPLAEVQALEFLVQTARALSHAHGHGIIHRDVKPANLMVTTDGTVKLADLGLARAYEDAGLTLPGRVVGTPNYMSPEQTRGEPVDGRCDLFCLGATFYHLLSGKAPFADRTVTGILRNVLDLDPPDLRRLEPDLSEQTAGMIAKMLAKNPDERYDDCAELVAEIEEWQRAEGHKSLGITSTDMGFAVGDFSGASRDALSSGDGSHWPYASATSQGSLEDLDENANPSRIQILPSPTEISAAIRRHRQTTLLEPDAPPAARRDNDPARVPGSAQKRPAKSRQKSGRPAPAPDTARNPPRRLRWWLAGVVLGGLFGAVAGGVFKPWRHVDWEKLGLPQVNEWIATHLDGEDAL